MGSISTGIGLVSGINSAEIIAQLIQLERQPILKLENRIQQTAQVQLAFTQLSTRLSALRTSGTSLRKPSTFQQVNTTSSNEQVLTATALPNTAQGSYTFRVARMVQSQQLVSHGFATADATPVGAGTISLELGNARLDQEVTLEELNDGRGVRRGIIEIVDRQRRIAQIDVSDAVTLEDVVDRINASSDIDVSARIESGQIILENHGGGTDNFRVRDITGAAAEDLGLLADTAADTISGGDLVGLTQNTLLSSLNDGRGVATGTGDGLSVTLVNGTNFNVDLLGAATLGEVIERFNTAAGGSATLEIAPGNQRALRVVDSTIGVGSTTVAGLGGSTAASDLGIEATGNGTITGRSLLAGYGSVLLSSLLGGSGLSSGQIEVTNGLGATETIDLSGAVDVQSLIDGINAADAGVVAKLNSAGNGIDLIDTTGGSAGLQVADVGGGTLAASLGWGGTHADGTANGVNLQRAWFSEATALEELNGGRGINLGKVKVTDTTGRQVTLDFTVGTFETVADVLAELNDVGHGLGISARINDNGDGLIIEDTAGGALAMKIEDIEGATAKNLRIAGETTDGAIDGSYEVQVEVDADDSLENVRDKINALGFAARAEVLNSGGANGHRLSLVSRQGGQLGAFVFDAGATGLSMSRMSKARDAAVFIGSAGAESPLMITSRSNQMKDVVPGLTLDLHRPSDEPVTISIDRDVESIVGEMNKFVEAFNTLRTTIDDNSKFNQETGQRGLLLGEPVVGRIERQVYSLVQRAFTSGNPRYRILADIGISMGSGAKLELNEEKFRAAWADDPQAVERLFSENQVGFGHLLQESITNLTDPVDGLLTRANETLSRRTEGFEEQIARLEVLVASKRQRLTKEFTDLELALSRMQFQQQQLSAMPTIDYSASSKKN